MVGLLDLRVRGQSDVTGAERRGVFGDLWVSPFLQSGEEEGQWGWCMVSSFLSPPLSLSLSLPLSWSSGPRTVVCFLLICARRRRNLSFISFFSSDRIRLGFLWVFFYRECHGLAEKLLLIIFIFWQISSTFRYALILCAETLFFILKKVSALIIYSECSRVRLLRSLFCAHDKERDLFRSYNIYKYETKHFV